MNGSLINKKKVLIIVIFLLYFANHALFSTDSHRNKVVNVSKINNDESNANTSKDKQQITANYSEFTNFRNYIEEEQSIIPFVITLCQKDPGYIPINSRFSEEGIFREATALLKSMVITTKVVLRIIIVCNSVSIVKGIENYLSQWPVHYQKKLNIKFSQYEPRPECMQPKHFILCSSVRLFYHEIFPQENAVVHIDSDFIFLESPEKILQNFQHFDNKQFLGVASEAGVYEDQNSFHEVDYPIFRYGLQVGLLLMNLTRIRNFQHNWTELVYAVCRSYKGRLPIHDQGVINLIFSEFQENIYDLDCRWNYNLNYCFHHRCPEVAEQGNIFAIHGSNHIFFLPEVRKLKICFDTFEEFKLDDKIETLINSLEKKLESFGENDECKHVPNFNDALLFHLKNNSFSTKNLFKKKI